MRRALRHTVCTWAVVGKNDWQFSNPRIDTESPPPRGYGPHLQFESGDPLWHPTTADEIKAYIGINIAMGIKNLPGYKDYWSTEPLLHDAFISGILTRTRYEKLCQYLHCSVPGNEDRNDKLAKVRPLITLCEQNFGQCYQPSRDVSIDEVMVQFDGRLCWKQYMPKKPVKWGIKLWCLCDSTTGFCANFSVYCGRDDDDQDASLDLGCKVVMRLMRDRLQRYHHVYADNFFTSVHLAEALLRSGTYLCGTTRSTRRDFTKGVVGVRLAAGESVKWTNDANVTVIKWHDKRDVYMVVTNDAGGDEVVQARRKRQEVQLTVPTCIRSYNRLMGGVDHMDQMRSYYGVGRAGPKWWKYLFWGLINIGLVNAHVLWSLCHRPLPSNKRIYALKSFKMQLVHNLVDGFHADRRILLPAVVSKLTMERVIDDDLVAGHPLVQFAGRKRVCHVCSRNQVKTKKGRYIETSFGCITCKVYTCKAGRCFRDYHA